MNLSVIIPAHNEESYICECLKHALKVVGKDAEVIVVDNASTDRTAEIARAFPGVRVVHEPVKGLAYTRTRGVEEARGEYLAFIDADTRIPDAWLSIAESAFLQDPHMVSLSGPFDYYDLTPPLRNQAKIISLNPRPYAVIPLTME